ncbi:MAG TPA: sodium:proton antiporter [Candidatus Copromorpha excrementipullorum]|uniref:Sodium:proton antiporter n=1 Tax=Candidatus Allocopromorpha excrementipullorum TaxID=2840743 RepID=A0A9D1SVG7_9FIRM|nr:sodium:proton antiporter [Candidatus Copromorpha excrementipullorum]
MDNFGILTLLPPLVIIVFALVTKRTFEALLLGAVIGFFMTDTWNVIGATLDGFMSTCAENIWMILVFGLLGGFTFLLQRSKGALGFGKFIRKFAKSEKSTLILGWILGIIVFMDDYLNILTISASLRETCDKYKSPREMLAYVIDSTGAPVCVLIPLSTWAVFYAGVVGEEAGMVSYGSGMDIYIQSLPFILYGWVAVIVVPLVIFRIIPMFGPMKKAYERVATTGRVYSEQSDKYNKGITEFDKLMESEKMDDDGKKGNIWFFLVPLAVVIFLCIYTGDLLTGLAFGIIVMLIMYLPTKALSFSEFCEGFASGFASMVPMMFITMGALTVQVSMDGIGLADFVIDAVLPFMNASLFPAITFLVVAGLSFITGSNWGIPALTVPILIPLALAGGANPLVVFGAIVSGGTFGSHACFYSDATVLTSQCCGIENMEHALTQIPFAAVAAGLTTIGFLICGFAF